MTEKAPRQMPADDSRDERGEAPEWLRRVQFVAAYPTPPEKAAAFGTTINGMWGDPARWTHVEVKQAHAAGRRVVVSAALVALPSRRYEADETRHLLDSVCRDINGDRARVSWFYWDAQPVYSLCIYDPAFRDYLLQRCRRAIDEGVDAIMLDEICTSVGLMNRKAGGSGFCERCLGRFCDALERDPALRQMAGISCVTELRTNGYRDLLRRLREDDSLYQCYVSYHEAAAFRAVTGLIAELRSYARRQGRQVAITANLAGLGSFVGTMGKLWGAMWGEALDVAVFENTYLVDPGAFHQGPRHELLPRGKFTAWYRLGSSFSSGTPAWICPQIHVPVELAERARVENYLTLMFLESYANGGRWAYDWWSGYGDYTKRVDLAPEKLKAYIRFIGEQRRYYEEAVSDNGLAVIYLGSAINQRPKGHSRYLALAQALAEAGFQYDVLYSGDDVFTPSDLDAARLSRYRALLLPEAEGMTERQSAALAAYARGGGDIIAYSRHRLPSDRTSVVTMDDDRLLDFWDSYREADRTLVVSPLAVYTGDRVLVSPSCVNAICYRRGAEQVLHLLNYDYQADEDAVAPHEDVTISVPAPGGAACARWLALEGESSLPCRRQGNRLLVTIPRIDLYGLLIIAATGRCRVQQDRRGALSNAPRRCRTSWKPPARYTSSRCCLESAIPGPPSQGRLC